MDTAPIDCNRGGGLSLMAGGGVYELEPRQPAIYRR
jgi:hypothetical protein